MKKYFMPDLNKHLTEEELKGHYNTSFDQLLALSKQTLINKRRQEFLLREDILSGRKKILDVGCYIGLISRFIAEKYPRSEVVGIDVVKEFIEAANVLSKSPNTSFIHGNILTAKIKEKFDVIIFLETIEHVDNPIGMIRHFHKLLNKGGTLIISTPDCTGITNVLRNIKHKSLEFIKHEKQNSGTEADHLYCWDKITLTRLLNRNGFELVDFFVSQKYNPCVYQSLVMVSKKR